MFEPYYIDTRFAIIDLVEDLKTVLDEDELNQVLALLRGENIILSEAAIRKLRRFMLDQEKRHG